MQIGVLAGLNYEEAQHGWAADIGDLLASLMCSQLAQEFEITLQDPPINEKRQLIKIRRALEQSNIEPPEDITTISDPNKLFFKVESWIESRNRKDALPFLLIGYAKHCLEVWDSEKDADLKEELLSTANRKLSLIKSPSKDSIDKENLLRILQRKDVVKKRIKEVLKELQEKLVILLALPDPSDQGRVDLLLEQKVLQEVLLRSRHRDSFEVHCVPKCTVQDLSDHLIRYRPNFLHFCGHGERKGLCFEDKHGNTKTLETHRLANILGNAKERGLRAVFMNACHSEAQAQAVANATGAAISMKGYVADKGAIYFTELFYKALGEGFSLEDAFEFAIQASPAREFDVKARFTKEKLPGVEPDRGQERRLAPFDMPWITIEHSLPAAASTPQGPSKSLSGAVPTPPEIISPPTPIRSPQVSNPIPLIGPIGPARQSQQYGLHVVAGSETETNLDLIFVHGLGSTPDFEWKAEGALFSWLEDPKMLRAIMPSARVLTFDYNSIWCGTHPVNIPLDDLAKSLRQGIELDAQRRAFILIGHGYGGLIVEKAVITGGENFAAGCKGVVLLGSPNLGSWAMSELASYARSLARKAHPWGDGTLRVDTSIDKELKPDAMKLQIMAELFRKHCQKYGIVVECFHELLKTTFPGIFGEHFESVARGGWSRDQVDAQGQLYIVKSLSACLKDCPSHALNTNHFGLNKFSDPADPNYRQLVSVIKKIADNP